MIITKTPVRISLFSGGSDLPAFFEHEDGAALNVTIDKYIYVFVHHTHNKGLRLKFDGMEYVGNIFDVKHAITKGTLRHMYGEQPLDGWEIASVSDVPYNGCGLGTSSAFTVGLLNCLYKKGLGEQWLANEACKIEIFECGMPIGKQDQYAAAFGGFNLFEFHKNGTVSRPRHSIKVTGFAEKLLLVYTGISRDGNIVLKQQTENMVDEIKFNMVRRNRDRAYTALEYLNEYDFDSIGDLMNDSWQEKKEIAKGITNPKLDLMYEYAILNGALGGKVLGSGGGGFFLFYVPTWDVRKKVLNSLTSFEGVKEFPFNFSNEGSKVLLNDRDL